MRSFAQRDSGFSAVWTAIVLLFLIGAAALAVDASEFWQQATAQQRAADLACLAGVREAPTDRDLALTLAGEYGRENHPGLKSINTAVYVDSGNVRQYQTANMILEVETPYNAENTLMRVRVLQPTRPTSFGRVLGSNSVSIVEEAYCEVGSPLSLGELPLALDSAAADDCQNNGDSCRVKFNGANCVIENGPGNCGSIDIPRHDDPAGSQGNNNVDDYELNLALGANWDLDPNSPAVCRTGANTIEPCGFFRTVTGNKPPQLTRGFITSPQFGAFPGRLRSQPPDHNQNSYPGYSPGWDNHYLNDVATITCKDPSDCKGDTVARAEVLAVKDCTDPRWGSVPEVAAFGPGGTPVDYVQTHYAWIQEPDGDQDPLADPVHPDEEEFAAANQLQIVAIRIITFPNGEATYVANAGRPRGRPPGSRRNRSRRRWRRTWPLRWGR
jgi:Flp pilus assembly protein TadG